MKYDKTKNSLFSKEFDRQQPIEIKMSVLFVENDRVRFVCLLRVRNKQKFTSAVLFEHSGAQWKLLWTVHNMNFCVQMSVYPGWSWLVKFPIDQSIAMPIPNKARGKITTKNNSDSISIYFQCQSPKHMHCQILTNATAFLFISLQFKWFLAMANRQAPAYCVPCTKHFHRLFANCVLWTE